MAGTPKLLGQFKITSTGDTLYLTVPASKRWVLSMIHVANCDTSQRTVRLNHVQSGGSVSVDNRIMPDSALPASDFVEFFGGAVMATGDMIRGLADAANVVSVQVYGIEESV